MALPILGVVAGVAARAAAKKAASRAVGGIAGKGAKKVNPVYRMMDKQTSPLSKSKPSKPMKKSTIKINSNPNKTPAKSMRGDVDAGKYSWRDNVFNSREGTGPYGEPTYNRNAPIKPFKIKSSIPKKRGK